MFVFGGNSSAEFQIAFLIETDLNLLNHSEVLILFRLTELSCCCSKQKLPLESFFYLYLKSVFKKVLFTKSLVFWKKNEKQNEIKF